MEGTIAVVTTFAADFAPRNWALCNGQILAINTNQALFSLVGTTYGGNGTTTFALPNLQSRTPVSQGQGPGLSNYTLGQFAGAENVTLLANNLPGHVHTGAVALKLSADSSDGSVTRAVNSFPAVYAGAYATAPGSGVTMATPAYNATIGNAGTGQPMNIRAPFLAINYIICLFGIFPSRN
jgi:microcystin-dependent protein